ncbi:AraC family transcriptional regulator [Paenibacillus psychroresistens]|uniref:AraC family transcriptional regulator n=1 Tax=Paenibacillus psychroresistens TaxID=1778678 RepID=A0A6B8RRS0_9BACL|nr:AraC family transcriptional regulator [Paenibacillus psychroresistens]QGQ98245.1 AraC family transcriptional regulator [Paenibacillus psychroresistens]
MKPAALLEPMDMPNPHFPVKVHRTTIDEYGKLLFPNHWHKHIEFLFCLSGKAIIECNSVPFTMETDDLIVVNSNDLHAGVSASTDLFYYALIFDPEILHSPFFDATETKFITPIMQNLIMFSHKITCDLELKSCFLAIVKELKDQQLGYELSIKSYLFRILTLLLRNYVAQVLTVNDHTIRMKNLNRFAPILQCIEESYQEELTIDLLADMAGLSRFHFSRLFKELTGKTVTEYVNGIRIGRAEYLLYNTAMTVSEIAIASGFHDIYYFSRIFKQYKHVTPTDMRKNRSTLI